MQKFLQIGEGERAPVIKLSPVTAFITTWEKDLRS